MVVLGPSSPALGGSALSPASKEALRRLSSGRGGLLFVVGTDRRARSELLRAISAVAQERQLRAVRLHTHPLDRGAPYGALHPWFERWYRPPTLPPGGGLPGSSSDRSFFTVMAGLLPAEPSSGPVSGMEGGPSGLAPAFDLAPLYTGGLPSTDPTLSWGSPELPALDPTEMRARLVEMVEGRSRDAPTVVTVDDAELIDRASRDWLVLLSARLSELPLFLVLSLQEESGTLESWRRAFRPGFSVWERWPVEESAGGGPPRIAERLRALPAPSREALAAVALAGPDARLPLLRDLLGWETPTLRAALGPAVDAGLLTEEGEAWFLTDPSLYPDLVGTLAPARAATLHRAIAKAIEEHDPAPRGPRLVRLSEHWAESGEDSHALPTLINAGLEAARWGSPELGDSRLVRAIRIAQSDPTPRGRELEQRVYAQLALLRRQSDDLPGAVEAYERALALARERGERPVQWGYYVAALARVEVLVGRDPEDRLRSTLEKVRGRSVELEATLLGALGYFLRERGRREEAARLCEEACALSERGSDVALRARAHNDAAVLYALGGADSNMELARKHAEGALGLRQQLDEEAGGFLAASAHDVLSWVEIAEGHPQKAVEHGEQALAAARRAGWRYMVLEVLGNQAEIFLEVGDLPRARDLSREMREQCDRYGFTEENDNRQLSDFLEARVALARGQLDEARRRFDHLASILERQGWRLMLAQTLAFLVVGAVEQGDWTAARAYLRRFQKEGLRRTLPTFTLRHLEEAEKALAARARGS